MIKQICILTKSYKHGGFCVAGIDINTGQWIRLVNSDDPNTDEIRKEQMFLNGKPIECLDIIEYDFIKNISNGCQTENWLLNTTFKPRFIKSITIDELINLIKIEKDDYFIFNNSNLLSIDEISKVNRSLFIFHVQNLKIEATTYESYGEIRFRYKCSFDYNNQQYTNISLTDPVYRDIAQDGLNLTNALIVASLPCVPYNDDLYYKFVAKIIPIEEQVALYIENLNEDKIQNKNVDKRGPISSPFVNFDLVVQTQQTPGVVLFENYEQLKQNINNGISYYSGFEYSLDNYEIALKHHNELKCVKNVLEKTKREVIKSYNTPLEIVENQLEELINLVKVPFKKVDTFIKQNQKNAKKYEIYIFSKNVAISNGLQEHMDNIFRSPAYFEPKWLNSSCSKTAWKSAVLSKIKMAAKDINQILSMTSDDTATILAQYYQTLSMEKVEEFLNSLKLASNITEKVTSNNYLHANIDTSQISINTTIDGQPILNDEHLLKPTNKDRTGNLQDSYVLNCVADSINPYTGEIMTGIDNDLRTKLIEIAQMLDALSINKPGKQNRNKQGEGNLMSGERWSEDEELMLIEEFKQGLSIQQISEIHKRKTGGIRSRLRKLKLID